MYLYIHYTCIHTLNREDHIVFFAKNVINCEMDGHTLYTMYLDHGTMNNIVDLNQTTHLVFPLDPRTFCWYETGFGI